MNVKRFEDLEIWQDSRELGRDRLEKSGLSLTEHMIVVISQKNSLMSCYSEQIT